MKLFLISIGITFVLIMAYLLAAVVVVVAISPDLANLDPTLIGKVDIPFRGPKYLYYYFFPPTAADFSTNPADIGLRKAVIAVVFLVVNLLLYSLPVYILMRFFTRLRNANRLDRSTNSPPSPPSFR